MNTLFLRTQGCLTHQTYTHSCVFNHVLASLEQAIRRPSVYSAWIWAGSQSEISNTSATSVWTSTTERERQHAGRALGLQGPMACPAPDYHRVTQPADLINWEWRRLSNSRMDTQKGAILLYSVVNAFLKFILNNLALISTMLKLPLEKNNLLCSSQQRLRNIYTYLKLRGRDILQLTSGNLTHSSV